MINIPEGAFLFPFIFMICMVGSVVVKTTWNSRDLRSKHPRADEICAQCDKNGPTEIWKQYGKDKVYHLIILLDDGLYGDWIVTKNRNGGNFEITCLIPKDGDLNRIHEWLSRKAFLYEGEF